MNHQRIAETADVVIVGGGVMGASLALHLALREAGRIVLLERAELCSGSTGRSVASVDLLTQHPPMAALHLRSLYAFQHCKELYGDECGWVRTGFAVLGGADAADGIREAAAVVNRAGGRIELLSPDDYAVLDPACDCGDAAAISWAADGGYLDPVLLTYTFVNRARELGVKVHQGEPVQSICRDGERVTGVRTQSREISAGSVVVAAGPWCAGLVQPEGIDLPLQPRRHSVAVLACPAERSPGLSLVDLINMVYARPESGGVTLCGSVDLAVGFNLMNAGDECGPPTLDYGMWVWERMVARYPGMERGELRKGWSGPIVLSPDGQPLLGRLPLDGLYCACGFSGAGMKVSPAVGELLASLIVGDEDAVDVLAPLRPSRFAENQPLRALYALGQFA